MSFLQNLHTFGTIETTRSYSYSKHLDPVQRLRMNFIENARRQIFEVKSDAVLSVNAWVVKQPLGGGRHRYRVSLRVGPKLIQLPGGTHVVMNSSEKVIEFLEGVITACEAGELDDLLLETSTKGKVAVQSAADEAPMTD